MCGQLTVHIVSCIVGCVPATCSWVMLWYNGTYMVVIGKKLQTNENLKRYSYQAQTGTSTRLMNQSQL